MNITQFNVGRIAERIVANELEARGFRVSDLNSDGTAANSDLLAVSPDLTLQIQVKGSTNTGDLWWVGYGNCTKPIIDRKNSETMFNRRSSFYKATHVVLVAVRSPKEYSCIVLPVEVAEEAAQLNLDTEYRTLTRDGREKVANKVFVELEPSPNALPHTIARRQKERALLAKYRDEKGWAHLRNVASDEGDKMTPEEALKNIQTLIDGTDEMEDLNAYRLLIESIRVLAEKGLGGSEVTKALNPNPADEPETRAHVREA
jgi:Holliday junction resolvase